MARSTVLVTGASGEMGHLLVPALHERGHRVVALDLSAVPPGVASACVETYLGSVTDERLLSGLFARHRPDEVFHLAAVLSTKAEADPDLAHRVNVDGTVMLLRLAEGLGASDGRRVRFLFPSSIAVYGLPGAEEKARAGAVREDEWNRPAGVYGCNKLYCEHLGRHLSDRSNARERGGLDFRSIRFPGLISADTLPSGGTSDYAPEMIHAAARGAPYACFVSADTRMPFMTMPDGVAALLRLAEADVANLSRRVYNIGAFSPSAGELREAVLEHFPSAVVDFRPTPARQAIVDSWPTDVDDSAARRDWGHAPAHGLAEALGEYLVPAIRARAGVEAGS